MNQTNYKCHQCGLIQEAKVICPNCKTDAHILNLNHPIDAFIAANGFGQILKQDLPESIKQSLREIP